MPLLMIGMPLAHQYWMVIQLFELLFNRLLDRTCPVIVRRMYNWTIVCSESGKNHGANQYVP